MKKRRIIVAGTIFLGAFLSGMAGYILSSPIREFLGPPRVTVVNVTGEPIHDITVLLGPTETKMEPLKENQFRTVKIRKNFPETAPRIRWSDSTGNYEVWADDYIQNYGFYHSTIILPKSREALVVSEAR